MRLIIAVIFYLCYGKLQTVQRVLLSLAFLRQCRCTVVLPSVSPGRGLGSIEAGQLIEAYGTGTTFRIHGVSAVVLLVLFIVVRCVVMRKCCMLKKKKQGQETENGMWHHTRSLLDDIRLHIWLNPSVFVLSLKIIFVIQTNIEIVVFSA